MSFFDQVLALLLLSPFIFAFAWVFSKLLGNGTPKKKDPMAGKIKHYDKDGNLTGYSDPPPSP